MGVDHNGDMENVGSVMEDLEEAKREKNRLMNQMRKDLEGVGIMRECTRVRDEVCDALIRAGWRRV